ncbi:threonine-phosphate decarboxylase CobD [Halobacillus kuroshimensis]|uniref:threonine-phosphate decarboxylase CobD n=1 Tax=Halobacillus kuroshimensis TaxID=302481 RepID=UPI00041B70AE|nr:threonine-phosphate decarboxylase CobD [Halobacillus kuroshimensis]
MNWPSHGANPYKLYEMQGKIPKETITDFSVNTNPYGSPEGLKGHMANHLDLIHEYPDPEQKRLTERIALMQDLPEEHVLVGNGASELIHMLARFWQGRRVGIIQPTFSEYQKACEAYGCEIIDLHVSEKRNFHLFIPDILPHLPNLDLLILCHPNNPTGRTYRPDVLYGLLKLCEFNDVQVVIDEAFYDFVSGEPFFSPDLFEFPNVLLLRSLTKMYSIPGLRLGYLMGEAAVVEALKRLQPEWSVNALAEEAGMYCLSQEGFARKTAADISREKAYLFLQLKRLGYTPLSTETNFFLMRDPFHSQADDMIGFLLQEGLTVRHTNNFKGLNGAFVRVAVKQRTDNEQLLEALEKWRSVCLQ